MRLRATCTGHRPARPTRRAFLATVPALMALPTLGPSRPLSAFQPTTAARGDLRVTAMDVFGVRATARTSWVFVRLRSNRGVTGLGEASMGRRTEAPELSTFFDLVRGESPFDIEQFRQRGWPLASAGDRRMAAAFSAVEQALWDLAGRALDAPVNELGGGALRNELPVYANINRATVTRTPDGFAVNAARAVAEGFRAVKAAPFDGFPSLDAPRREVERATDLGVACVEAIREAVGPDVAVKIDCHSFFNVDLAIAVARRLEPQRLSWYEEPVAPTRLADTTAIQRAVTQRMAGGEFLFGTDGFAPLCQERAVDVIMPDVKYCGGLLEGRRIATIAELYDVAVSPHNPSGPVATAASIQLCAGMPNFDILEHQWNEVPWRGDLVDPPERFADGVIPVPDRPGFGVELNERLAREHAG